MAEHHDLYYLFLEDRERNPMAEHRKIEIQKNIEKFYEKIKPPPNAPPLPSEDGKTPNSNKKQIIYK